MSLSLDFLLVRCPPSLFGKGNTGAEYLGEKYYKEDIYSLDTGAKISHSGPVVLKL